MGGEVIGSLPASAAKTFGPAMAAAEERDEAPGSTLGSSDVAGSPPTSFELALPEAEIKR